MREAAAQGARVAEVTGGAPAAGRTDVESDTDDLVAQSLVDPFSVLTEDQSLCTSLVFPIGVGSCAEKAFDCGRRLMGAKGWWKKLLVASSPKGIELGSIVSPTPPTSPAGITAATHEATTSCRTAVPRKTAASRLTATCLHTKRATCLLLQVLEHRRYQILHLVLVENAFVKYQPIRIVSPTDP
jgi:hypothetical protein